MKKIVFLFTMMLVILFYPSISFSETQNQIIRIGLFHGNSSVSTVNISGNNLSVYGENGAFLRQKYGFTSLIIKVTKTPEGSLMSIDDNEGNVFSGKEIVIYSAEGVVKINNAGYRGGVQVKLNENKKMTVINQVYLEEYLYGVVPKEMSASWNQEALKAQAIAARTYSIRNLNKYANQGFDLCATQNCQVYGGIGVEDNRSSMAVDQTRGLVMYYMGEPIQAVYHSSSGGMVDYSQNVWYDSIPYLQGMYDMFSVESKDSWNFKISGTEIENKLKQSNKNIGELIGITIDSVSEGCRVKKISFIGTQGTVSYEKESIRKFFGYSTLKSNLFVVNNAGVDIGPQVGLNTTYLIPVQATITGNEFEFRGKGYGHGLGMSQYGAKKMGELGYNFVEILKFYYNGVEVY